jgi:hypothetical protein
MAGLSSSKDGRSPERPMSRPSTWYDWLMVQVGRRGLAWMPGSGGHDGYDGFAGGVSVALSA